MWLVKSTLLRNQVYLVKLSMKGEVGQKSPKNGPRGLCMTPNGNIKKKFFIYLKTEESMQ